jgi:hypothetical protein
MARGLLDYFPAALAEVAHVSLVANEQHNPGEEMHHARGKSTDHADCIIRHLIDRGTVDGDGLLHSAKVAWRALALLQEELEAVGAPMARAARVYFSETDMRDAQEGDPAYDMLMEEVTKAGERPLPVLYPYPDQVQPNAGVEGEMSPPPTLEDV